MKTLLLSIPLLLAALSAPAPANAQTISAEITSPADGSKVTGREFYISILFASDISDVSLLEVFVDGNLIETVYLYIPEINYAHAFKTNVKGPHTVVARITDIYFVDGQWRLGANVATHSTTFYR